MDDVFLMQVQTAGIQVLESASIIATSKNIDTIISRYEFLLERISSLKKEQSTPQYSYCMQQATSRYREMYPNRPLQDYQLSILSNPNNFDLNDFYSSSLLNAMKRFCGEQIEEINAMKKETAKTKRAAKVFETITKTINELQTKCSSAASYAASLSGLQNLQASFNKTI